MSVVRTIDLRLEQGFEPIQDLLKKSEIMEKNFQIKFGQDVQNYVSDIISKVKDSGDEALRCFAEKFDGFRPDALEVSETEIEHAYNDLDDLTIQRLKKAADNIVAYQKRLMPQDMPLSGIAGAQTGGRYTAVRKAGIYVPGGRAPLCSSVLMNVIPAVVAGVKEIYMCTPAGVDGLIAKEILAAAKIAGATKVFRLGGAQAIAALAYGTETVPAVDTIAGPGNIFVTYAKKEVFGKVNIDMLAGPSEVLIVADNTANPRFIAADMLAQAEHDPLASAIAILTDENMVDKIKQEIEILLKGASTEETARQSLRDYSAIVLVKDMQQAIDAANLISTEHLMIQTKDNDMVANSIVNAGAIFIGSYSSEALGDYFAGPCHTLPTGGSANAFSALSCLTFIKQTSLIKYSQQAFNDVASDVVALADLEGLHMHKMSVEVRREQK